METEKQYYCIEEFAKSINYGVRTVRVMCQNGEIAASKMGNHRKWQIPVSELGRLKKAGTVGAEQITNDEHFNELAVAALKVADFFASLWPYDERDETSIAEEAVNTGDYEFTRFMDQETGLLFVHIQADLPDLISVKSFCDLQVKNLNKELVEKLRLRGNKRDFLGRCEGCP